MFHKQTYYFTVLSLLTFAAHSLPTKPITKPPVVQDTSAHTTKQQFTTTTEMKTTTTTKQPFTTTRATTTAATTTTAAATTTTTATTTAATPEMTTSVVTASPAKSISIKTFVFPATGKPRTLFSDIPQRDESSSVTYGYDLLSMGAYRANMITQFINTMLPYTGYGNFRVVSFAHCPVNFNVPTTSLTGKSYSETRNSVNIAVPGLANVIREMRKGNETKDSTTTWKKNTAVLFVDPSVTAITQEVLEESEKLKNEGSKVFLVNVGRNIWPQPQLLHSISSQPYNRYIYNFPTYNQLLYTAHNTPFKLRAMCKGYRNTY
ncbi:Hypothetical predicted protein [Octopus vulgaris]|uniref:VWFA domain-containing protein n=1 Tax=Octopus vulgaris TaxID=6645 RepID=A0AA36ASH6_OCTVU|nr:Hypothetical predicted protein [Octopus vulgaris]